MKYYLNIILLGLLFIPTLSYANTVSSENFELRGADGSLGGQMTYSGEGTPALFLYDTHGVIRVSIGLYGDGAPGVVLNDNTGKAGALMRLVTSGGDPVVVLKEGGQDKIIIDSRGRVSPIPLGGGNGGGGGGNILSALIGALIGALTALIVVKFMLKGGIVTTSQP